MDVSLHAPALLLHAGSETESAITSTTVMQELLLYRTGGDDLRGWWNAWHWPCSAACGCTCARVQTRMLILRAFQCLNASDATTSASSSGLSGGVCYANMRSHLTWRDADVQPFMLSYTPVCLDSNARVFLGTESKPVENNSCECQMWECQGSLTFGGHTHMWMGTICQHHGDQL